MPLTIPLTLSLRLSLLPLVMICTLGVPRAHALETVTVFAAASTKPALDALVPALRTEGIEMRLVYAGSSHLAKQIAAGAPAGVYVSANTAWMDHLEAEGLLEPGTRRNVAGNRLAVIAAPGIPVLPEAASPDGARLLEALGMGRLAIADPDHVPAGIYGREALHSLGLWDSLKDRLAPTKDVTGALMLVARGETPLGIVYRSDARRAEGIGLFAVFPTASHTSIVYPAAIVRGHAAQGARKVLDTLSGAAGRAAFKAAGFAPPPDGRAP